MGFFGKILGGITKVGRFIGNVAGKIGNVAGVLSKVPVIGGVASTVARVANTVSKVGTGAAGIAGKIGGLFKQNKAVVQKVGDAAKAVYNTGIPDKMTGGAVSRVIDKTRQIAGKVQGSIDRAKGFIGKLGANINPNQMRTMVNNRAIPHRPVPIGKPPN